MTRFQKAILVFAFMFAVTSTAGAMTAGQWEKPDPESKAWFLLGMIEDWGAMSDLRIILKQRFPAEVDIELSPWELYVNPILSCLSKRKMPGDQLVGLVDKYVKDHPNAWDKSMISVAAVAVRKACEEDGSLGDK